MLKRQGINEGDGPEDRQIGSSKQICMATGERFVVFISWPGTLPPLPLIPPAVSADVKEIVVSREIQIQRNQSSNPIAQSFDSVRPRLNFVEFEVSN